MLLKGVKNRGRDCRNILNVGPYSIRFPGAMVHDLVQMDAMMEGLNDSRRPEVMIC